MIYYKNGIKNSFFCGVQKNCCATMPLVKVWSYCGLGYFGFTSGYKLKILNLQVIDPTGCGYLATYSKFFCLPFLKRSLYLYYYNENCDITSIG